MSELEESVVALKLATNHRDRGNEEVDFGVGFVTRIDVGAVFWIVVGAVFWIVVITGNFSSRSRERIRKTVEKVMAIGVIDRVNVIFAVVACLSLSRSSRSIDNWGVAGPRFHRVISKLQYIDFGGVKYLTKVIARLAADGRQIVGRTKSEANNYESLHGPSDTTNLKNVQEGRAKSTQ
ncbi:unnamed protein product [Prunus armeniaca]